MRIDNYLLSIAEQFPLWFAAAGPVGSVDLHLIATAVSLNAVMRSGGGLAAYGWRCRTLFYKIAVYS